VETAVLCEGARHMMMTTTTTTTMMMMMMVVVVVSMQYRARQCTATKTAIYLHGLI